MKRPARISGALFGLPVEFECDADLEADADADADSDEDMKEDDTDKKKSNDRGGGVGVVGDGMSTTKTNRRNVTLAVWAMRRPQQVTESLVIRRKKKLAKKQRQRSERKGKRAVAVAAAAKGVSEPAKKSSIHQKRGKTSVTVPPTVSSPTSASALHGKKETKSSESVHKGLGERGAATDGNTSNVDHSESKSGSNSATDSDTQVKPKKQKKKRVDGRDDDSDSDNEIGGGGEGDSGQSSGDDETTDDDDEDDEEEKLEAERVREQQERNTFWIDRTSLNEKGFYMCYGVVRPLSKPAHALLSAENIRSTETPPNDYWLKNVNEFKAKQSWQEAISIIRWMITHPNGLSHKELDFQLWDELFVCAFNSRNTALVRFAANEITKRNLWTSASREWLRLNMTTDNHDRLLKNVGYLRDDDDLQASARFYLHDLLQPHKTEFLMF